MVFTIEECDDNLFEVVDGGSEIVFTGSDEECEDWIINNSGAI